MENYAQFKVDTLYEVGELDYHFLYEFFGMVESYSVKPFTPEFIRRHKTREQQFEDVLKLVNFFISDGAYEGFYMPDYRNIAIHFKTFQDFNDFLNQQEAVNPHFMKSIVEGNERYTIGLVKVIDGAQAPKVR